jgi:hypothetical protein
VENQDRPYAAFFPREAVFLRLTGYNTPPFLGKVAYIGKFLDIRPGAQFQLSEFIPMKKLLLLSPLLLVSAVALADNTEKTTGSPAPSATSPAKDAHAKNLLKPTNDPESWQFDITEGGRGDMKVDGDAIVFNVTDIDETNWHVQALSDRGRSEEWQGVHHQIQSQAAQSICASTGRCD